LNPSGPDRSSDASDRDSVLEPESERFPFGPGISSVFQPGTLFPLVDRLALALALAPGPCTGREGTHPATAFRNMACNIRNSGETKKRFFCVGCFLFRSTCVYLCINDQQTTIFHRGSI
jgi:hypothetical protein